jgi:hypothetical protein
LVDDEAAWTGSCPKLVSLPSVVPAKSFTSISSARKEFARRIILSVLLMLDPSVEIRIILFFGTRGVPHPHLCEMGSHFSFFLKHCVY